MKRLCLSKGALAAWTLVSFLACSSDPPVDKNSFQVQNKNLVDLNCSQSLACLQEKMLDTPANYITTCEKSLAQQFHDKPESQAVFLHAVYRCGQLPGCSFADCATMDVMGHPPSFGEDQAANVTFGCQQKAQCLLDMKMAVGDVNLWVNNCVASLQGTMYTWTTQQRNDYLDNIAMCGNLFSCALLSCYKY